MGENSVDGERGDEGVSTSLSTRGREESPGQRETLSQLDQQNTGAEKVSKFF